MTVLIFRYPVGLPRGVSLFGNIDKNVLLDLARWMDASEPEQASKEDLINDDWSTLFNHIYGELRDNPSETPDYLANNAAFVSSLLRSMDELSSMHSAYYQIVNGITPLAAHDMAVLNIKHEISLMGLGREPRVPTLEAYCNSISAIAYHNQTEKLKLYLLAQLSNAEKQNLLAWAIRTEELMFINEHYREEEFMSGPIEGVR